MGYPSQLSFAFVIVTLPLLTIGWTPKWTGLEPTPRFLAKQLSRNRGKVWLLLPSVPNHTVQVNSHKKLQSAYHFDHYPLSSYLHYNLVIIKHDPYNSGILGVCKAIGFHHPRPSSCNCQASAPLHAALCGVLAFTMLTTCPAAAETTSGASGSHQALGPFKNDGDGGNGNLWCIKLVWEL